MVAAGISNKRSPNDIKSFRIVKYKKWNAGGDNFDEIFTKCVASIGANGSSCNLVR